MADAVAFFGQLLDDWRPYGIDGCPVESEAAIAYDTLDRLLAGPGVCGMPARYHRPCQETGPASPRM